MSRAFTILRRPSRLLAIPMCAFIVGTCAYVVASAKETAYSAEALAVVNPNAQLTADQAKGLAVTYAVLIPHDAAIVRQVATSLGTRPERVEGRISAFNTPDTAVLRVGYRGTSASSARAGALAVLLSLTGGHPASPNITPRSIGVVQAPERGATSKRVTSSVAIGALLGVALGVLLMVALQRVDPRVDSAEDMSAYAGCPVSVFGGLSNSGARALMERWEALAGRSRITVALVPVTDGLGRHLRRVALVFSRAGQVQETVASGDGSGTVARTFQPRAAESVLIPGGVPGADSGEALAMASDVTVLVVQRGTRRSDVRGAVEVLREFGVDPVWAILLSVQDDAGPRPAAPRPAAASPLPTVPARQPA
jgi:capsular polysaccharide biosynthesis protein